MRRLIATPYYHELRLEYLLRASPHLTTTLLHRFPSLVCVAFALATVISRAAAPNFSAWTAWYNATLIRSPTARRRSLTRMLCEYCGSAKLPANPLTTDLCKRKVVRVIARILKSSPYTTCIPSYISWSLTLIRVRCSRRAPVPNCSVFQLDRPGDDRVRRVWAAGLRQPPLTSCPATISPDSYLL